MTAIEGRQATRGEVEQWFRDWDAGLISSPLLQLREEECRSEGHIWHMVQNQRGWGFRWCVRCGNQQDPWGRLLMPAQTDQQPNSRRRVAPLWLLVACAIVLLLGQVGVALVLFDWHVALFLTLVWLGATFYGIQIGLQFASRRKT
jgi:hypothetical protein